MVIYVSIIGENISNKHSEHQICFFCDNNKKSYLKSEIREVVTGQCHQGPTQIFEIELIIYICLPQSTKRAVMIF